MPAITEPTWRTPHYKKRPGQQRNELAEPSEVYRAGNRQSRHGPHPHCKQKARPASRFENRRYIDDLSTLTGERHA